MTTTEHTITLEGREIMYDVTGAGPAIVFVHGVWATGGLWYNIIDRLADRFRCINIHLPLGVHRYPSPPDVDHSPAALARVISGLMDALDLRDATLVGNDTGGALCQLVIAAGAPRVGRLVLTNCDAFEVFPPRRLAPFYAAAKVPALWWLLAQVMRAPRVRQRFWWLVAHAAPDLPLLNMLLDRFAKEGPIRRDLRLTIRAIDRAQTLTAARSFSAFDRDVLVLWGMDDVFFPVSLGRRLAAAFRTAPSKRSRRPNCSSRSTSPTSLRRPSPRSPVAIEERFRSLPIKRIKLVTAYALASDSTSSDVLRCLSCRCGWFDGMDDFLPHYA